MKNTSTDIGQTHYNNYFLNQIQNSQQGKYRIVEGKLIRY